MLAAKKLLIKERMSQTIWGQRIIVAEANERFTENDAMRAGDWLTCACGEVDRHVEMISMDNGPVDHELNDLGLEFSVCVGEDRFEDAAITLVSIEKRSIELLQLTIA